MIWGLEVRSGLRFGIRDLKFEFAGWGIGDWVRARELDFDTFDPDLGFGFEIWMEEKGRKRGGGGERGQRGADGGTKGGTESLTLVFSVLVLKYCF